MGSETAEKNGHGTEIRRTGHHDIDLLQMYESSTLYDCTFKVGSGNAKGGCKEFKCHKLVLAMASSFFEITFGGNFKESKVGRDDAIELSDVTPEAFDCAMRFVYGHETNFVDIPLAIQVYQFANKMLMEHLTKALEKFFTSVEPKMIFAVYNLYKLLEIAHGLEFCRDIVFKNSKKALASEWWTVASPDTVLDAMQANCLNVTEFDKLKALVKWGRAQLLPSEDEANVRRLIEKYLMYVRLFDLEPHDFAQLCRSDLLKVLSAEEKISISESIALDDEELMPLPFRSLGAINTKHISLCLPFTENSLQNYNGASAPLKSLLQFEVNRCVQLVALQLINSTKNFKIVKTYFTSFNFQLRKSDSLDILAGGHSADILRDNFFKVSPRVNLDADTKYSIDLVFPKYIYSSYFIDYTLSSGKNVVTNEYFSLKLHSNEMSANITQLMFKLA